ncbi:NAD(P)H-quinone oxidoreductase [Pararhizobium mangrovi]|uniref:NAD(P)H-quinone oxidoreductase n=1 Tax=Pararhizobium mangrovi TaxID=2590452 RepID=A0A506U3K0_9HYPH|nr:NAD(P)H-quinone oxidoreductase [Pararhizobium mangrovi]TPW27614.1 NAD(P)H-quinone oxidoreductase [Pararhizobium mangrovi]
MRAVSIREPGGPEVLRLGERERPEPGEGELLVRVRAAGVNRPDVFQRQGRYDPPEGASDVPGLEIAGEVAAIGPGASEFREGDAVCALLPGGGYAEYCVVHASNALPVPEGFSFIHAAALPETFFTVWHNVFQRGGLKRGETFLVHGGSSGIGTTAIQLASAFGASVFATAGTKAKCDACRELGAFRAIDYREEDFVEIVRQATDGAGVDVILDMVGGDYIARNYEAAAFDGRIVQIAFLKGAKPEVNFAPLMAKRLTHTGSTLRARSVEFKAGIAAELRRQVWPLLEAGRVKPIMDTVYPLARVEDAHRRIDEGEHIGKIVLEID